MQAYQKQFIEFALANQALRFGYFTLKSGRVAPHFFNIGCFHTGEDLMKLGTYYADAIVQSGITFDVIYGPAYKGIPLACATAMAFSMMHQKTVPYCFNRKEVKEYGEMGQLVGADIKGKKVLLLDDTITAGTAIRESMRILEKEQAKLSGIVVALDRQDCGHGKRPASEELALQFNTPVHSIVTLADILTVIKEKADMQAHVKNIIDYQEMRWI